MNERYFTNKIFYRFFFPAIISCVCLGFANLADALCVGIVLGEPALAAISLVSPIFMVFNVFDLGIAVGGAITFTRWMGQGQGKKAADIFQQMLLLVLCISLLFSVCGVIFLETILKVLGTVKEQGMVYQLTKDYTLRLLISAPLFFLNQLFYHFIRCDNGEKRASVGLILANVLDVGLSFVLVLFFDMGIKGAIWATIVGTASGVLIYLPHFYQKDSILRLRFVKPDCGAMFRSFMTGFSSSSQYLAQFALLLILNNLLMRRHGEGALAVMNVVLNVSYVVTGLYEGIGATIQPLAATFKSERNQEAQNQTMRLSYLWGLVFWVLLGSLIAFFARQIVIVFGLSAEMMDTGVIALRWYCFSAAMAGLSTMLCCYWQATDKEKETFVLSMLRSFAVYILLAIPLAFGPLARFFVVFPLTEAISLLVFYMWRAVAKKQSKKKAFEFGSLDMDPIFKQNLRGNIEAMGELLDKLERFCEHLNASGSQTYLVTMAVEEMCQAIFLHSRKDTCIQITLFPTKDGIFELHIRDNGPPFDPFSMGMKRISEVEDESAESDALKSMGVLLVKKKAKEFYYRHYQGFNTLTVRI